MKKLLYIAILLLFGFVLFKYQRTTQPPVGEFLDTLIVGTSSDFAPFSFRDQSNEIIGFDIDVVNEIAKRLNKKIVIEDMRFEMLLPQLQIGNIHVVAAGLTPTPERAKSVLFTKPYLTGNPLVVLTLAKNPIDNLEHLKDKEIVVNLGYSADAYMSKIPDIKLTRLSNVAEAFNALEKEAAFAFVTALNTLKPIFEKHEESKFSKYIIKETDEENALAISPKYLIIQSDIQKTLDQMQSDGTIEALKTKWKLA